MDSTVSVSKGCFVFKNGATRASKQARKSNKRKHTAASSMLDKDIIEQPFYSVYSETWHALQQHIEQLQEQSYARTLKDLVDFVVNESKAAANIVDFGDILPAAALLTGINQPDHLEQFETLAQHIRKRISASICMLRSRDCATLKSAVESLVHNLIEATHEQQEQDKDDNDDENEDRDNKRLRRSQCNMRQLQHWYENNFAAKAHALIIILPDFECFNASVLQDFILILSAHCEKLPFLLVLGVATAISAIHNSLPYHVTSKIKMCVFKTQPAPQGLNEILDKAILSPQHSFHLSGKALKFLTHIFVYYDFSINNFIQAYKYCLMEHYFQGNAYALCSTYASSLTKIQAMSHEDMESIRHLLSFRPYVEGINDCKRIIAILTDDNYLKKKLPQLLRDCHMHFITLRVFLEFLLELVADLPKCPLGKHRYELYATSLSKVLVEQAEFKECFHLLEMMSKDEFVCKITKAVKNTEEFMSAEVLQLEFATNCQAIVQPVLQQVQQLLSNVLMSDMMDTNQQSNTSASAEQQLKQCASRRDFKERLLQMSKLDRSMSEFAKNRKKTLDFIQDNIIRTFLKPLQQAPPLHELFVFANISTVRRNIIGAPRAALHMALNNPHFYLQCKCCALGEQSQLLPTMPDLAIVYKLHLESGRMINLFDWLQAFRAVVDYNKDEQEQMDPQIQARFSRAVAELQFLGYIKMSKRKTDHATRLTW